MDQANMAYADWDDVFRLFTIPEYEAERRQLQAALEAPQDVKFNAAAYEVELPNDELPVEDTFQQEVTYETEDPSNTSLPEASLSQRSDLDAAQYQALLGRIEVLEARVDEQQKKSNHITVHVKAALTGFKVS
ncbi:MAG: hypothetical protein L6R40_008129 [Gallowayella cf. fulva]|nr:MAG: hypothetical protein L6R40_008129 [Xanthomendoza cf. fulva]